MFVSAGTPEKGLASGVELLPMPVLTRGRCDATVLGRRDATFYFIQSDQGEAT